MHGPRSFQVRRADWSTDQPQLARVRRLVFVVEQHVPEADEWDGLDEGCQHAIALAADGDAIGCGRLISVEDGVSVRIGRMAVLRSWRRSGVGSALLQTLLQMARGEGRSEVRLHAQTHALAFYRKHGFECIGADFMEAGIPHCEMRLQFKPPA